MTFQPPIPVAKVLESVNDRSYVLPAIQREFVWSRDQICLLFDSLLRGYPIGSFLFWRVKADTVKDFQFYDFLTDYHEKNNPYAPKTSVPAGHEVVAILDGQQRLTALNIGLYGSHAERLPYKHAANADAYPKRRLYLNLLEQPPDLEELGMKYDFRFLTDAEAASDPGSPDIWFRVGFVLQLEDSGPAIVEELSARQIDQTDTRPFKRLFALYKGIRELNALNAYLEESQDPDKVLDIFVRVNSAGTVLSYSDLLLSMATNQFKNMDAREVVRALVKSLNNDSARQFGFSKDRVLKAGLALVDVPDVGFKVSNFTKKNIGAMETAWPEIQSSLIVAASLLADFGFSERTLTADSVLIPVAYYAKHRKLTDTYVVSAADSSDRLELKRWVLRSLMKRGTWGSALDTLLVRLRDAIREHGGQRFPSTEIQTAMAQLGKSLQFEGEEIEELAQLKYGGPRTFAVLAILYPGLDLSKAFHTDHIFPRSLFTRKKLLEAGIPPELMDQYLDRVDVLPNLQLLGGGPNVEKQAKLPTDWLAGPQFPSPALRQTYEADNDLAGLPLSLDRFLEFFDQRQARIEGRLRSLLA